jgi:hypothetical protein
MGASIGKSSRFGVWYLHLADLSLYSHTFCHFYHYSYLLTQALVEILLLSGGTPYANFKDLAHAWGRDKGFHHTLANAICERRGAVERKRRSDAGKRLTPEEREHFRQKLKKARTAEDSEGDGHAHEDDGVSESMGQQQHPGHPGARKSIVREGVVEIPTETVHI